MAYCPGIRDGCMSTSMLPMRPHVRGTTQVKLMAHGLVIHEMQVDIPRPASIFKVANTDAHLMLTLQLHAVASFTASNVSIGDGEQRKFNELCDIQLQVMCHDSLSRVAVT